MKSDISKTIVMMLIFLVTVMASSNAQHHNGRLEMCKELGKYYTHDETCLNCEDTGREIINGECKYVKKNTIGNLYEINTAGVKR